MKTSIFQFSGTGNSLWAARELARELEDASVLPMPAPASGPVSVEAEAIGMVFPVYIWGLPARVIDFVGNLRCATQPYLFAIATNGGQVAGTLVQLKSALSRNGLELAAGFELLMPSNYAPWGQPGPKEKWQARLVTAKEKIARIAKSVSARDRLPVEKGPLHHRVFFTLLYKLSFNHVPGMDKSFWTNDACSSCGTCLKVCPSGNISLRGNKPVWNHQCEQCLACLQWCPKQAVQFGKKTANVERYHHPEVKLRDLMRERAEGQ